MSFERHTTQRTGSFLVRCWDEPRERQHEQPVVRVYVRNLKTGEEHYLNDLAEVGELLRRDLAERQRKATDAAAGVQESEAG